MKKTVAFLLFFLSTALLFSQDRDLPVIQQQDTQVNTNIGGQNTMGDTNVNFEGEKPPITEYKIISHVFQNSF